MIKYKAKKVVIRSRKIAGGICITIINEKKLASCSNFLFLTFLHNLHALLAPHHWITRLPLWKYSFSPKYKVQNIVNRHPYLLIIRDALRRIISSSIESANSPLVLVITSHDLIHIQITETASIDKNI